MIVIRRIWIWIRLLRAILLIVNILSIIWLIIISFISLKWITRCVSWFVKFLLSIDDLILIFWLSHISLIYWDDLILIFWLSHISLIYWNIEYFHYKNHFLNVCQMICLSILILFLMEIYQTHSSCTLFAIGFLQILAFED